MNDTGKILQYAYAQIEMSNALEAKGAKIRVVSAFPALGRVFVRARFYGRKELLFSLEQGLSREKIAKACRRFVANEFRKAA